jgi:transglutaminase-like putative cysteine protease
MDGARSVLQTVKTIEYQYEAPVREVTTQLRLFPRARRGSQRLLSRVCDVWPRPDRTRRFIDDFGNEVWEFLHASVVDRLRFTLGLTTEHAWRCPLTPAPPARLRASQGVRAATGLAAFLAPTALVNSSPEIERAARQLAGSAATAGELMEAVGHWVCEQMQFCPGVTTIETPASAALAGKRGVCQDFTHVMLAICRSLGLPARYVSGFIPGEGYMHAWAEVLVADSRTGTSHWEGFDPTHNRRPDAHYLAIAAGRDYADVSPVTGWFYGSAMSCLTAWSATVLQGAAA